MPLYAQETIFRTRGDPGFVRFKAFTFLFHPGSVISYGLTCLNPPCFQNDMDRSIPSGASETVLVEVCWSQSEPYEDFCNYFCPLNKESTFPAQKLEN